MRRKSDIRLSMKQVKRCITPEQRQDFSEKIRHYVEQMPEFRTAKTILLYHSLADEVDTSSFLNRWKQKKRLLLPVVKGEDLAICDYNTENMKTGSFGILEPEGIELEDLSSIDMVIVPGVAFDRKGNRLGRGKGYYDRLLPRLKSYKIGICYDCQIIDRIPADEHDIPMDHIVTESGVI